MTMIGITPRTRLAVIVKMNYEKIKDCKTFMLMQCTETHGDALASTGDAGDEVWRAFCHQPHINSLTLEANRL